MSEVKVGDSYILHSENGVCSKCYEIRLSAMQKCNSNRKDGFNEYWKRENNLVFGGKIL